VVNAFHAKMKAEARYASLGERLCCLCENLLPGTSAGRFNSSFKLWAEKCFCLREVLVNSQEKKSWWHHQF